MTALLEIEGLDIDYRVGSQWQSAVRGVSLALQPGEILGLVGESGCGKSTLARGIIRLLPKNGRIAAGSIRFEGRDILTLGEGELLATRWARISMICRGLSPPRSVVETIPSPVVTLVTPKSSILHMIPPLVDVRRPRVAAPVCESVASAGQPHVGWMTPRKSGGHRVWSPPTSPRPGAALPVGDVRLPGRKTRVSAA